MALWFGAAAHLAETQRETPRISGELAWHRLSKNCGIELPQTMADCPSALPTPKS